MDVPITIRLDDEVRRTLEAQARRQGLGLAAYIRDLATDAARRLQREHIHAASEAMGRHVAASAEDRQFYADWATPRADVG